MRPWLIFLLVPALTPAASVCEAADSLAAGQEPLYTTLPMQAVIEWGTGVALLRTSLPKPEHPKAFAIHYAFAYPAHRRHRRQWFSLGSERAEWKTSEPVTVVSDVDSQNVGTPEG